MELRDDKNFIEHLKMAVKKRLKETEKPNVISNGSEDNLPAKDQNCLRHGGYPGSTQVADITPAVVKDTFIGACILIKSSCSSLAFHPCYILCVKLS